MYYFEGASLLTILLLVLAAIIPVAVLLVVTYKLDRLEKEPPRLLFRLVLFGIFSTLIALALQRGLKYILDLALSESSVLYNVLFYFGVVGFSEEGAKYINLKRVSWNQQDFNTRFDGILYAVYVSLGFAVWENIGYVLIYGFKTALTRAIFSIPGHACFGVFMGIFYGLAKKYSEEGNNDKSALFRILAIIIPALIHGAYDYILSTEASIFYFIGFIAVVFIISLILVIRTSKHDAFID